MGECSSTEGFCVKPTQPLKRLVISSYFIFLNGKTSYITQMQCSILASSDEKLGLGFEGDSGMDLMEKHRTFAEL